MKDCDTCARFADNVPQTSLREVPELKAILKEISTGDWTTFFECTQCGRKWEEYYTAAGQASVPNLRKKPSS